MVLLSRNDWNGKIGVDVFTFQIKAILEVNWNHDCWRKVKSSEKKGQVPYLAFDIVIYFLRHFLKSSKRSIIKRYPIWSFDFLWFDFFSQNTNAKSFTTRQTGPLEKGSLPLKYNRHTSIFEESKKLNDYPNWTYGFLNTCSTRRRCPFVISASTYPFSQFSHQACFVERSQWGSRAQKVRREGLEPIARSFINLFVGVECLLERNWLDHDKVCGWKG